MTDGRINERILRALEKQSGGDESVHRFLLDVVYDEVEHPGQWRWKRAYRTKVREHAQEWGMTDED